ncbi:MAG: tetratricopeptide repeat protein [Bacteroidales bacterium]|nr:tetratricopeptide repeat protein [Bacteroidales bacterium]
MDKQDKFEKYILGQMTEPEKAEFENELENNPLLKEQLELEQDIVGQIRNRAFVDRQINVAKKELQRGKVIRLIFYSVTSIAALFLVFFVVHGVWQGKQCDNLYAANFTTYTDYLPTDGSYRGDAEIDSLLLKAMLAYEKKDFTSAETQFSQILSTKDNPEIRFYLAIAQLETGKIKEALNTLQMLYNYPIDYRYYEQTRWYLALVHLKLHHKSEAKKYLDELVALDGEYLDKAKELLGKL